MNFLNITGIITSSINKFIHSVWSQIFGYFGVIRKETYITISFILKSFKISEFFSYKIKIPEYRRSYIHYESICAGCNAIYVGETQCHIKARINEHLDRNKRSHVFQDLAGNDSCKSKWGERFSKVIDTASSAPAPKLKEALHVKWRKPTISGKKQQVSLLIF